MKNVTNVMDIFPKRLKELRGEKTLQTIADDLGISRISLGYYEKGERKPDIEMVSRMADYFNVSADYLIGISDVKVRNESIQFIHDKTGLSEKAINSLCKINRMNKWFPNTQNDKLDAINLILSDEHEPTSFSSLLDILAGYFQFNIDSDKNTFKYTLGEHGIIPCQVHKIGNGVSYDPSQVHFGLQDLESMYYLRIWDAIKELKEEYKKQKQASTA
ncbi:MAG: helix-turn-helix domain-containing protein [Clostridiales bacterium]|nr:helix-turn-helix domain-containing protein [Clostridiales bacterium]